ncbi:MAG: urease accessory protein UreF [Synechococcus sp.]|nr:urease accessory protein UreF [Synechococcus sp.]
MTSLALLQLVSPALPVGAFSYSEGLEVLVQTNGLNDEQAVQDWLTAELIRGALRLEVAALPKLRHQLEVWVHQGDVQGHYGVENLDGWLLATREASELRAQQRQMGQSLVQLLNDLGHPLPEPVRLSWPAAWAWAASAMKIPVLDMLEGYLYGWVANQLSAAVRLVPLGPSRAQLLQHRLLPLIKGQAEQLQRRDPRQLWTSGVGAGMAQLAHAELYSRLFRS